VTTRQSLPGGIAGFTRKSANFGLARIMQTSEAPANPPA